jgi:uncharacterized protein YfbU (UPF0304 family)
MSFTTSEKLQIAMLCDLAKPEGQRELDFEFISRVVSDDNIWALSWKYPGLQLKVETPSDVRLVADILEMWDNIESGFAALNEADEKRVKAKTYRDHKPKFLGFDGNNETNLMAIARILTRDIGRWERFSKRELNSHSQSIDVCYRLLSVWRPISDAKVKTLGPYELTAGELIAILREWVHPENRKPTTGGNWVLDESKK